MPGSPLVATNVLLATREFPAKERVKQLCNFCELIIPAAVERLDEVIVFIDA